MINEIARNLLFNSIQWLLIYLVISLLLLFRYSLLCSLIKGRFMFWESTENLTVDKESIKKLLNKLTDRAWICLCICPRWDSSAYAANIFPRQLTRDFVDLSLNSISVGIASVIDLRHWNHLNFYVQRQRMFQEQWTWLKSDHL